MHSIWGKIENNIIGGRKSEEVCYTFIFEQSTYRLPIWDDDSNNMCENVLKFGKKTKEVIGWLFYVTAKAIAGFFIDVSMHLQRQIGKTTTHFQFDESIIKKGTDSNKTCPQRFSKGKNTDTVHFICKRTESLNEKIESFKVQHTNAADKSQHNVQELDKGRLDISLMVLSELNSNMNVFRPLKKSKVISNDTMDSRTGSFFHDSFNDDEALNTENGNIFYSYILYMYLWYIIFIYNCLFGYRKKR